MNLRTGLGIVAAASLAALALGTGTDAQAAVGDFYKGKTIKILIGLRTGSTYDAYARTVARHMGAYIPGKPKFLPQNMPGAGSLKAYNYLANVAPKDGTALGTGHRFVPIMPLFGVKGPKFGRDSFAYVGSVNKEVGVCIAWHETPFKTFEDVLKKQMILGTSGRGSQLTNFTSVLITGLGAKFRVITGYRGTRAINLAIVRHEIDGRCGVSYGSLKNAKPEWLREKKVAIFLQMRLSKQPELPKVPNVLDLAKNDLDRKAMELLLAPTEMGRPLLAPGAVPKDRIKALQAAFSKTMTDKGFLADAAKQRLAVDPLSGTEVQALLTRIFKSSSPDVVARAKALTALSFKEKKN